MFSYDSYETYLINPSAFIAKIASSTNSILNELTNRQQLLIRLVKLEAPDINPTEDTSLLFTNSSNLLENSISLLNTLSMNLNNIDTKKLSPQDLAAQIQNTKLLLKLEDSLNKLRDENSSENANNKLPSLILPNTELDSLQSDTAMPAIGSDITRTNRTNRHSFVSYRNSEPNTATTIDLSEDEQINYYDDEEIDEDENSKNNDSEFMAKDFLMKAAASDVDEDSEKKHLSDEEDEDEVSEDHEIDGEDDLDCNNEDADDEHDVSDR